MAEQRDQLLEHYARTRQGFLAAIDGLSDEVLAEPSLDGWSIADQMSHLALWDEIRAADVERISAGHASAWRMTRDQVATYNDLGHSLRASLSAEQARWELIVSRQRLLDAIANANERALDANLYGEAALRSTHEVEHADWINNWRRERGV